MDISMIYKRKDEQKALAKIRRQLGPHHSDSTHQDLFVLFYGRKEWYDSLTLQINVEAHLTHSDFDSVPADIARLDAIVVDCIQEDSIYLAMDFLEYLKAQRAGAKICLSYKDRNDLAGLQKRVSEMFPSKKIEAFSYSETKRMQTYLQGLRMAKR